MAPAVGGALSARWRNLEEPLVLAAAAALLVIASLLPLVWPLVGLLGPSALEGAVTLSAERIGTLILRSLVLSLGATAAALVLGVPLGVILARTDVPGRRAALLLHAFPMFLPPFFLALGWFHLFGTEGLLGGEWSSDIFFSEAGAVGVLALTFTPVVTSLVALGLWGIDASLEEAARVVAGPVRVAARILLPAVWPVVALAAIVVFALSFSELGVPMFLRVDVYPAAVFALLGGIDPRPGEAFLLVLPLLPFALFLLALERRLLRGRSFAVMGLSGRARAPLPLGGLRPLAALLAWLLALVSLAPIASLAIRAGRGGGGQVREWMGSSLWNSLAAAGIAATFIAFLGLVVGHALKSRRAGAAVLDGLSVLAFFTPATVLGVGLIALWNRPLTAPIYGSLWILVLGYLARYPVIGIRTLATAIIQSPPHLEEAAAAFGAGYLRRLIWIVSPLHLRGIAGAWLLALVFCLRDLETAVLFYPPGKEPLTVRIFTLEANGPEAVVAALALLQVGATAVLIAAGAAVIRWGERA